LLSLYYFIDIHVYENAGKDDVVQKPLKDDRAEQINRKIMVI
jgi:hypothetical protein